MGPVSERHTVTGAGMDVPAGYEPEVFRRYHGIDGPFALYLGRREADKGWPWLLEMFAETETPVKLVSAGAGTVDIPRRLRDRVIDVGVLSPEQRNNALAAALAYVQPSLMESYSRTVMESWLAGRPVLARKGSAVVEWHCSRSEGGLVFSDEHELASCLERLLADPVAAAELGERGRSYVLENYKRPVVLDRMEADLVMLQGEVAKT